MPFLIVETIEKGSKKLSICPDGWVANDILSWPIKKSTKKCKIEDSMPKENWLKMPCIIKRNLNNYDAAEEELNEMVELPETDQEGYANVNQSGVMTENFNHIAKQLSSNQSTSASTAAEHSMHELNKIINIDSTENYIVVPNFPHDNVTNQNIGHVEPEEVQVVDYDSLIMNQKILSENQIKIIDNQFKIMKTLATISVKIDKMASNKEPQMPVTKLSNEIKKSPFNTRVTPIKNLDGLQHMENELRDVDKRKFYKDLYSVFCTPGKKGEVCAFQLIDVLFSREFLVQCSWSGSARGAGTKICIKIFQEVLGFFFELVHDCDPSYTVDKNNNFFKSVVKNALKRTQTKLERTSTPRQVLKRKLATKQQNKTMNKCKQSEGSDNTGHETIETIEIRNEKARHGDESVVQNELVSYTDENEDDKNENEEKHKILDAKNKYEKN